MILPTSISPIRSSLEIFDGPQSSPFFSSPTRSLTLKGKPHFADFILVPYKWGGFVNPWIDALAKARVGLEELRLKKMASS
ncbi:hypothetical protein HID58_054441 [Brassica napus]|uniref:Transport inhibitor response 1 domain-containing protein n=1 Tax=Brassica napus TaxID=3708 RepID=A0ABQ8AI98_BRANA|nr:hypothetical protein HID58_054441 [Brassica napus]